MLQYKIIVEIINLQESKQKRKIVELFMWSLFIHVNMRK
jgi:hypothetical protein